MVLGTGHRCSCMVRNLETADEVDALVAEFRSSISRFIPSLVNRVCMSMWHPSADDIPSSFVTRGCSNKVW